MGDGITHSRPKAQPTQTSEVEHLEFNAEYVDCLINNLCKLHRQLNINGYYSGSAKIEKSMDTLNESLEEYLKPYFFIRGE